MLLRSALRDAASRGTVHATEARRSGKATESAVEDLGLNEGTQQVGGSGGWHARIVVVDQTAYISGNAAGLRTYFGFPAAVAQKVGGRWVSFAASKPGYAAASYGATLASTLATITPTGHLTETAPTKIGGTSVIGIRGTGLALDSGGTPSSITLFVSANANPLPLLALLGDGKGDTKTVTLSSWGEHLVVKAPHGAVSVFSLG
jgi:hypothetical protein